MRHTAQATRSPCLWPRYLAYHVQSGFDHLSLQLCCWCWKQTCSQTRRPKISGLVKIWQSSDEINFARFFRHSVLLLLQLLLECLQGLPSSGKFRRPEDVTVVCTSLIFTCTVLHSAVNYPQYNEYGFPPNYSLILNGQPPKDKVVIVIVLVVVKIAVVCCQLLTVRWVQLPTQLFTHTESKAITAKSNYHTVVVS